MRSFAKCFLFFGLVGLTGMIWGEEPTSIYKVLRKVHLEGDGGWDCLAVDSMARRVYVTHDKMVEVLDADSLKKVGTIEGIQRAHGVVLASEFNRGYATSGEDGKVLVFDLKTLKLVAKLDAQKDADAMAYDPVTKRVFSFNGDSGNATIIDAATDKVVMTLDLGGQPEFAVADGKGYLFDNLEDKSEVLKINAKTLKIEKRWPLAPGEKPSGMAMDVEHKRLFIGCRNQMTVVMNAVTGKVVKTLPIGDHVDGTAFDPASGTVFNSCGDGTLSVIHEDAPNRYSILENAKTEVGARTLALDTQTGHVFSATARTEPPPTPTKDNPKPRRKIVSGTFEILEIGK